MDAVRTTTTTALLTMKKRKNQQQHISYEKDIMNECINKYMCATVCVCLEFSFSHSHRQTFIFEQSDAKYKNKILIQTRTFAHTINRIRYIRI